MSRFVMTLLILFSAFTMVACGKSEAEKKVDSGNSDITRMNDINNTLSAKGVLLQTKEGFDTFAVALSKPSMDKMSDQDLRDTRALVEEYNTLCLEVIRIVDSGGVQRPGGTADLIRYSKNAVDLIAEIDSRLADKSAKPAKSAAKPAAKK